MINKTVNKIIPAFVIVALFIFSSVSLQAEDKKSDNKPEILVRTLGDEALSKLSGKEITDKEREKRMSILLKKYFDLKAIGRFALGKNWRKASDKQKKEYQSLFNDMVVSTYALRFKEYSGEKFEVTGSQKLNKRDSIVHSEIIPEDGPKLTIDWRIRHKNNQYRIIDVIIEGVSMSVTQRSEYSAIIQKGGGEIEYLLASFRE